MHVPGHPCFTATSWFEDLPSLIIRAPRDHSQTSCGRPRMITSDRDRMHLDIYYDVQKLALSDPRSPPSRIIILLLHRRLLAPACSSPRFNVPIDNRRSFSSPRTEHICPPSPISPLSTLSQRERFGLFELVRPGSYCAHVPLISKIAVLAFPSEFRSMLARARLGSEIALYFAHRGSCARSA